MTPPGYKQTEVGVIPEDWEIEPLGSLSAFVTSGSRGWAQFYSDSGALFIRSQNVRNGSLDFSDIQFVSPPTGAEGNRTKVNQNDLLITITGNSVGNVALVEEAFDEAYISQHVGLVRLKEPCRGSYVCRYLCPHSPGNYQISGSQSGQSKPGLNLQNLRNFLIALPPTLAEQAAIAGALSDADALIDSLEQLIAKKRLLKQGAMQDLLTGKKRLPGFEGESGYRETEIGQIPSDWGVKSVGEFASIKTGPFGTLLKASEYTDGEGVPVISVGEIREGFLRVSDETPRVCEAVTKRLPQYLLRQGDIVFGRKGGVERSALVTPEQDGWFLGSDGISIRPLNGFQPTFLALQLQSHRVRGWLLQHAIGTTMASLNQSILHRVLVPLPPSPAEQTAIAAILSDMNAEIAALEAKLAKARQVKQGMMQELLTGRIRLVPAQGKIVEFLEEKPEIKKEGHNWQINEAVILGVLAARFGTEQWPLPRKRRVKLTYLFHRHAEGVAEGYKKKAAGPYNPRVKYSGPETIALKNGYVREHNNGKYPGFVAGDKREQAEAYFARWYGDGPLMWLEQFRYHKTENLELLATVDMAAEDLRSAETAVDLEGVKEVIRAHPEWTAKLDRKIFSDKNIKMALADLDRLLPVNQ
ncbi:restriction endonuclease subunit S [Haloferula sargassicola]|uniref:Type I restriction modification DNA specificity domain-containing protein n=1 Tax=Haloferula sargassicola TaxID=490096 RepID=A0ABP9UUY8_9BACT